jgi:hypothetical protein
MRDHDGDCQAVEEMTKLLRDGTHFQDLAAALTARGFDVNRLLLADYLQSEELQEWGAFITEDGTVYEFERASWPPGPNLETFRYRPLPRAKAIERHPEVQAALQLWADGKRVIG